MEPSTQSVHALAARAGLHALEWSAVECSGMAWLELRSMPRVHHTAWLQSMNLWLTEMVTVPYLFFTAQRSLYHHQHRVLGAMCASIYRKSPGNMRLQEDTQCQFVLQICMHPDLLALLHEQPETGSAGDMHRRTHAG